MGMFAAFIVFGAGMMAGNRMLDAARQAFAAANRRAPEPAKRVVRRARRESAVRLQRIANRVHPGEED